MDILIDTGYASLHRNFDDKYGGFSQSPKFPTPHNLLFLLKYAWANKNDSALHMAQQTLTQMYYGGIYDHLGGGFSRYSTDRQWLVPHFEKMLYDNALLLLAYSEAFSLTKNHEFNTIIDGIAHYALRDMQSNSGGFFSAEDADSEGEEGKFYVFEYEELKEKLLSDELRWLEENYGVSPRGNFEGKNILHITGEGKGGDTILPKLYDIRSKRPRPFKDTKISVSWNGFMIEALCRAAEVTGNKDYIHSAKKAADFILEKTKESGELFGVYIEGAKPSKAFLSDYANFANGLIELYRATLDLNYLKEAKNLASKMISLFWDDEKSCFYMTSKDDKELFLRPKDEHDGAMPSGTSCALQCLDNLTKLTGDTKLSAMYEKAANAFMSTAATMPAAYLHFISLLLENTMPHRQIIICAQKSDDEARQVYSRIQKEYLPFTTLIFYGGSFEEKQIFPELKNYDTSHGFAAYVCENFSCQSPIYTPGELLNYLSLSAEKE
ncbi:MAG: thioredoxin domain-containing protein [Tissierellia bacterium]|nr:thioredoxin domain-containing protein [Tissierellia bacterium]